MYYQKILLSIAIVGGISANFAWIIQLSKILFISSLNARISLFFLRFAWVLAPIQYQALSISIETIADSNFKLSLRQKILCFTSTVFAFLLICVIIITLGEVTLIKYLEMIIPQYNTFIVMLPSVYIALKKLNSPTIPAILQKQGTILLRWFVIPQLICEVIQTTPLINYSSYFSSITNSFAFTSFSTLLMTCAMFFCAQKMIGLRFLNFHNHVQSKQKLNFINDFKITLQHLSQATTFEDLAHICTIFCNDALGIPPAKTHLYIRTIASADESYSNATSRAQTDAERFLETHASVLMPMFKTLPIMIYDEIEFTHFYTMDDPHTIVLQFLDTIKADIFLPIFEQHNNLIAYIIIDRHARSDCLYTNIERDEMIVFASYIGAIINLLNNKSLEVLIEKQQKLKHELHVKHKEIERYKESMRSFLHTKNSQTGVICYQNRRFIICNSAAKELVPININQHDGHPITQILKQIVISVESYRTPHTMYGNGIDGGPLVFSAFPHLEKNMIIITITHPNVADIIKQQMDMLQNPSEWDYLLYLETTQSGQLINQLIPGKGPTLLRFKIDLLKASMGSRAILLDSTDDDLMPTVELLNHISMRGPLRTIILEKQCTDSSIAITLFGANHLLNDGKGEQTSSIMEQLNAGGTLFIKNIHYLDLETQNYLAEYSTYGLFRAYKTDQKRVGNARIICSSNQNIAQRVQEGTFSRALYEALNKTTLMVPSLITLPEKELYALTEGFSEQIMHHGTFGPILALSEKEKQRLTRVRPISLAMLKQRVQHLLVQKSKKHNLYAETTFNPAFEVTDPDLMQAKCLGRHALRDRQVMALLWGKFKNQSDIAKFLNVDRSSVWRRCKEYGLDQ